MDTINLILARYNEYIEEMSVANTKSVEKQHNVKAIQNKPEHVAAQNTPQQTVQPQIAQPQVAEMQKPTQQQITPLNSASAQHVVKQRINLFIMAKYNQKAA